jgi:rhamnosyl/mannosyltransferase
VEHRVFTLSPKPSPRIIARPEAEVYRARRHFEIASSGFSLTALPTFRRLCEWADVVHYHFPWPFADILHLLAAVDIPTVVTYHSDIVRQRGLLRLYQPLMRRFLDRADCLVATSPNYMASSPLLRAYRKPMEVIPLGLDESSYAQPSASTQAVAEQRYGRHFFLFVGVLRYYKGLETLLEAVRDTKLRVVIAGMGPQEARLKELARELSLTNVQFAGHVSEELKAALFHLCRGVVFPSNARSEAFGITLLEGAMWSRPLICTDINTGTTFINRHGETGLVVPAGDPASLRRAMQNLYDDAALAERLGRSARLRFESVFASGAMGQRYADLYRRLCR